MIMVRELTDDEIAAIAAKHDTIYGCDFIALARALFEAARIQQTQDRIDNG